MNVIVKIIGYFSDRRIYRRTLYGIFKSYDEAEKLIEMLNSKCATNYREKIVDQKPINHDCVSILEMQKMKSNNIEKFTALVSAFDSDDNPNMLKEASQPVTQEVLASATDEGEEYIMGFTLMQG